MTTKVTGILVENVRVQRHSDTTIMEISVLPRNKQVWSIFKPVYCNGHITAYQTPYNQKFGIMNVLERVDKLKNSAFNIDLHTYENSKEVIEEFHFLFLGTVLNQLVEELHSIY
jgi:hypothetical protein